MLYLKQSTASQSVLLGPFVDDTDGATAETGLTIANTDIRLSANGGNMFAKTSGGGTHDEAGWYTITLDATDTATVGRLQISCKVAGALHVFMECQVLEEAVYDDLFATSGAGYLKPTVAGRDLNVAADGDIAGNVDGSVASVVGAVGSVTGLTASNLDATVSSRMATTHINATAGKVDGVALVDTVTTLTGHTAQTGDSFALANGANGFANIKTDTAAILIDTGTTLENHITDIKGTGFVKDTHSLTDITADVTGIAGAAMRGTDNAAVAGDAMGLTAGAVDAIWDEDVDTTHQTAGTAGKKLDDAGGAADPWATALPGAYGAGTAGKIVGDNINATVSSRMPTTHINATAGKVDNVGTVDTTTTNTDMRGTDNAALASVCTEARLAELSATNLPADIDTIGSLVTAIQADLDNGVDGLGALKTLIDGLNDIAASDILTTALTEAYAADGATATLSQLLYMIWSVLSSLKFVTTTGTARKLDGTTAAMTFTIDDADNPTDINRTT